MSLMTLNGQTRVIMLACGEVLFCRSNYLIKYVRAEQI